MFSKPRALSKPNTRTGLMTRQPQQTSKAPTATPTKPILANRRCASCYGGAKRFGR